MRDHVVDNNRIIRPLKQLLKGYKVFAIQLIELIVCLMLLFRILLLLHIVIWLRVLHRKVDVSLVNWRVLQALPDGEWALMAVHYALRDTIHLLLGTGWRVFFEACDPGPRLNLGLVRSVNSWSRILLWTIVGFLAVTLVPSLGLEYSSGPIEPLLSRPMNPSCLWFLDESTFYFFILIIGGFVHLLVDIMHLFTLGIRLQFVLVPEDLREELILLPMLKLFGDVLKLVHPRGFEVSLHKYQMLITIQRSHFREYGVSLPRRLHKVGLNKHL